MNCHRRLADNGQKTDDVEMPALAIVAAGGKKWHNQRSRAVKGTAAGDSQSSSSFDSEKPKILAE